MTIIPDPFQVFLNIFPFLVAILGMYHIILKPMVAYLDERNEAIEGGKSEAVAMEEQINDRVDAYDAELLRARQEIATLRADRRAEAQVAYDGVLDGVRTEADASITASLSEIQTARSAAEASLKTSVEELAASAADRVLGRELVTR